MVRKHLQYSVCLLLFFLILLSSACVKKPKTLSGHAGRPTNASLTASSSRTIEGKASREKDSIDSTTNLKGKCVFGCVGADLTEKKMEEKTASLDSNQGGLQTPSSDYTLGPEDVIEVSVWRNENLSRTVAIRPDGKISLPLIGDVQAEGLTTFQLRDSIKGLLKGYKEDPEVSIIVREINSLVVYITGEVVHPGKLMLRSDTSVLQAIILAGGFTQFASPNKIVLLRRVGGFESRRVIRYKDIVSGKKTELDVILKRGDTIVVP